MQLHMLHVVSENNAAIRQLLTLLQLEINLSRHLVEDWNSGAE